MIHHFRALRGSSDVPKANEPDEQLSSGWRHLISGIKSCIPYIVFIMYVIGGSVAIYIVEITGEEELDSRTRQTNGSNCVSRSGFSGSLFFVISASSTVGYGGLYPCTAAGKAVGTVLSLVGIPVALATLNDIGNKLCGAVSLMMTEAKTKTEKRQKATTNGIEYINAVCPPHAPKIQQTQTAENIRDMPSSIGIFLCVLSILSCSLFYRFSENYSSMNSIYYAILTLIEGDLVASSPAVALPVFAAVFIGLGLVSFTLHMVKVNLDNALKRMKESAKLRVERLQRDLLEGFIDPDSVDVERLVDDVMRDCAPWFLRWLMSGKAIEELIVSSRKGINRKSAGCTADISKLRTSTGPTISTGLQAGCAERKEAETTTRLLVNAATETEQTKKDAKNDPMDIAVNDMDVQSFSLHHSGVDAHVLRKDVGVSAEVSVISEGQGTLEGTSDCGLQHIPTVRSVRLQTTNCGGAAVFKCRHLNQRPK